MEFGLKRARAPAPQPIAIDYTVIRALRLEAAKRDISVPWFAGCSTTAKAPLATPDRGANSAIRYPV
jgi:hypothetical protein